MLWPKKNSNKEFDKEKKFMRLENSFPPITFLMVRPLPPHRKGKGQPSLAKTRKRENSASFAFN